ncbi:MAG: NUDIX domain-containing protein [Bacteroidetes bacterium]|nr:NUDIX domain-containing protein [Bacteroidota bacterium]MCY4205190.1 NUDIX domain-containing protein [Bacteroidota bacterium]
MLLYYPTDQRNFPPEINTAFLFGDLQRAQALEAKAIFVVDSGSLDDLRQVGAGYHTGSIPKEAILNIDPYSPPRALIAAGGIIRHQTTGELLCIKRHGVRDLPKGKLDPNESIADCAMRELLEETGIQNLVQGKLLGTTVHGYCRRGFFEVKTTYWYAFTSESTQFTPAVEEGISEVFWLPYIEAEQTLGYSTLSDFLMDLRLINEEGSEP